MEEFIKELEYNNKIKNTETVRIDYVIDRLKNANNELQDRINLAIGFINNHIEMKNDSFAKRVKEILKGEQQ